MARKAFRRLQRLSGPRERVLQLRSIMLSCSRYEDWNHWRWKYRRRADAALSSAGIRRIGRKLARTADAYRTRPRDGGKGRHGARGGAQSGRRHRDHSGEEYPRSAGGSFCGIQRCGGNRYRQLLSSAARRPASRDRGGAEREPLGLTTPRASGRQGVQQYLRAAFTRLRENLGTPGRIALPSPATMRRRKPSSCSSSTRSASTRSTTAASTIRGASSPAHRSTRTTSTRKACATHSQKPRRNEPPTGKPPIKALATLLTQHKILGHPPLGAHLFLGEHREPLKPYPLKQFPAQSLAAPASSRLALVLTRAA